jgi:DNA polymerase III alpha subunit
MSWHEEIREQKQQRKAHASPTEVDGISGIPFEAKYEDRFRLTVDVERVFERTTKAGDPCYFLHCRDADGIIFSVICWESQWVRFQGRVKEGTNLTLDVRVPTGGFSAFTLAWLK